MGDARESRLAAVLLEEMLQKDAYQVSRGRCIAVICDVGLD